MATETVGLKARGIYIIRNLKSDQVYLGKSENLLKSMSDERFRLDLGMHPCASLQEDYTKTGLELFVIEPVKEAGAEDDLDLLLSDYRLTYSAHLYPEK